MHQQRIVKIEKIAAALGQFAIEKQNQQRVEITTKSLRDFASEVDLETEVLARRLIADSFPGEAIIGEENGGDECSAYWIIDPIDGTTNYLRGHPYWAVSIAWVVDGEPVIGVIAMPGLNETLVGGESIEVRLNGDIVNRGETIPRLAAVGRNAIWPETERQEMESQLEHEGYTLVSLGCCAVECAFTALGRLDRYVQNHISFWDCAAGIAIAKAAGLTPMVKRHKMDCRVFSIK
ncbi:hypothetical protein LRP52_00950 [Photobacterium sp. ZSDE20]|uniref:Inositol monophosphatase n=1 Tax=Photobacterium pectinilyticum TaxID=2906793 RepID=A0ABT1MVW2_9GAMM|nr:inositol monophosphatase family protein [Photobacterium sp. ZSDE20]MCQ1056632.1 hypothetical protein [Photobacterium sp. ZSDE20]MDD1820767.1 hypothetical protein [Photobacterium sp. ZSDE20]